MNTYLPNNIEKIDSDTLINFIAQSPTEKTVLNCLKSIVKIEMIQKQRKENEIFVDKLNSLNRNIEK